MYTVLRGNCNSKHPNTFTMNRPNGINNYVLLIVKTPAIFTINDICHEISPNTVVLLTPNTPYSYSNPSGDYIDDWIHFETDTDENTINVLNEPTIHRVDDTSFLSAYIKQILFEMSYSDENVSRENVNFLMQILMNHISSMADKSQTRPFYSPYNADLKDIRLKMAGSLYNLKKAEDYACELGISKSHFQHLYSELFGISFQKDLIDMKITTAKHLLETSTLSIEQISEACGYSNDIHFFRQFKKITGTTPDKYRKRHTG